MLKTVVYAKNQTKPSHVANITVSHVQQEKNRYVPMDFPEIVFAFAKKQEIPLDVARKHVLRASLMRRPYVEVVLM